MSELNKANIETLLASIPAPYLDIDLLSAKTVNNIDIDAGNNSVVVDLLFAYPSDGFKDQISQQVSEKLSSIQGFESVEVTVSSKVISHAVQNDLKPMPNIKNVIAVASGKGGVGKSTTSANLALALAADGAKVGILDADIYGPSQPRMLGLSGPPQSPDNKRMEPKIAYGIQTMSIGYLIEEDTPMIWRGPMVTSALQQLCDDTIWEDLDYLIIDLPPGTGDIQLTLSQKIPVSGAVIVTTPQDIALLDAKRALKMFEKVDVPVLGIIENMSTHICSNCGHQEPVFGSGGGEVMAEKYSANFLGAVPLDISIRQNSDQGHPSVVADPDGEVAHQYKDIARRMSALLSLRAKDFRGKFPKIVVENR